MKESKFKGTLSRREVESLVNPLRDKEPTKAWLQELKEVLSHFDVQKQKMCQLTADSNKCNEFGRRYSDRCFSQIIDNFISGRGSRTWTTNAQKTVNDHLDVLVDYLSKPEDNEPETECDHVPTFIERLKKELEEGKWPRVEEKRRTTEEMVELLRKDTPPTAVYTKHEKLTANDIRKEAGLEPIEDPRPETTRMLGDRLRENFLKTAQRLESFVDVPEKAPSKVKLRKIHKRRTHKTHTITININLGR